MPKIYKRTCDFCDEPYQGYGLKYCSPRCAGSAKTPYADSPDCTDASRRIVEENKELRQRLAVRQKQGVMFEVLAEQIKDRTPILPVRPLPTIGKGGKIEEDVVCVFSDPHADQIILPERVLGFEDYGWMEFCRRFERWVDSIRDWTQGNLSHHRFSRLWLFCLGDNIQGDGHGATKHTTWGNTMKAALAVGDVLGQGIQDLADIFPEIIVVGLPGNHPRWAKKIDWGYSVPYMVTGVLNQHPRAAMAHMDSEHQEEVTRFFDSVTIE